MYKILKDCVYSEMCKHVEVKKGDIVALPEFVANSWLNRGICEDAAAKKKFSPVEETAVINPVEETKTKVKRKNKKK